MAEVRAGVFRTVVRLDGLCAGGGSVKEQVKEWSAGVESPSAYVDG